MMSDWLAAATVTLCNLFDHTDISDHEGMRELRYVAEQIECQMDNPGFEMTIMDLTLCGFARCVLAWLDDRDNDERKVDMCQAASDFRAACAAAVSWAQ